jgi:hypothetical protein
MSTSHLHRAGPQAIQTSYQGYLFRSRLEARWAVFFDALGLRWEYEPEGFDLGKYGWYLPDFRVEYPGRDSSERYFQWFEVKGDLLSVSDAEWDKMLAFSDAEWLIVLDGVPDSRMYCPPLELIGGTEKWDKTTHKNIRMMPDKPYKPDVGHKRTGWALWSGKGRLWWDEHSNYWDSDFWCDSYQGPLEIAIKAARSARFEHGETPRFGKAA